MTPEDAAKKAIVDVATALGQTVPPGLVEHGAAMLVGIVGVLTKSSLRSAEAARDAAADRIVTPDDVLKELSK